MGLRDRYRRICFLTKGKSLKNFLKTYARYGGIGVNWQLYGTSGIQCLGEGELITEHMVMRARKKHLYNRDYKTIVRPERVKIYSSAHFPLFKKGFFHVNEKKKKLPKSYRAKQLSVDKICLNHYWARDEEFFERDKIARRLKFGKSLDMIYDMKKHIDAIHDPCMHRHLPELKKRMGIE